VKGLEAIQKQFTPANKTDARLVRVILNIITNNPSYGPREVQYRLEEMGHRISESAVYNVMRREGLSTKAQRQKYSTQKENKPKQAIPRFDDYTSGACWLFWISFYGDFAPAGRLYAYTIHDLKSRIACSRLYSDIHIDHFIELLEGVAIPVAQSLKLEPKCWCILEETSTNPKAKNRSYAELYDIAYRNGFEVNVHILTGGVGRALDEIKPLMEAYTRQCLTELMPLMQGGKDLKDIKFQLQKQLREYNMNTRQNFNGRSLSPLDYHASLTKGEKILPVWAYMERSY